MTAALGTLPFLATLWLLTVVGSAVLEESGAKIVAALKGESLKQPTSGSRPARIRIRPTVRNATCANEPLRAAA
jgi:hypothetical protein